MVSSKNGHGDNAGAGNGTRTRDIKLGKLALYQLSYARGGSSKVSQQTKTVKLAPPRINNSSRLRYTSPTMTDVEPLYFFPDREVSEPQLREILDTGTPEQKAWAISHLLRYAQWDDIWRYTTREQVREMFFELELGSLQEAWGRMLKIDEAPATLS